MDFPFLRSPRVAVMDSSTSLGSSGLGARMPQYLEEHMGAIHKAANVGNLWRLKKILLFRKSCLNDRDSMSRTALHVACGKGHPAVVRLLVRRHCLLNLWDIDSKTALIHAIQYGQEECATILLDHGADPNVKDIHGNTALHYAVLGHNRAIVEKLISCMADIEVRNKDDFTPLSLAKYENKEKMVQFLVTRCSRVHQKEGNQQSTSEKQEKRRPLESSESNNLVTHLQKSLKQSRSRRKSKKVCEISEEGSLCRNDSDRNGLRQQNNSEKTDTQQQKEKINENKIFLVNQVEERKEQKNSKREESGTMYDGADDDSDSDGLSQHSNREQTDTQQPNDTINENAVILMNKVEGQKKQISSKREVSGNMHDGAEDNSDSVGVRKKSNTEHSDKQQLPIKENKDADRNGFSLWCCTFYSKRRIPVSCPTSDNVVFKVAKKNKQTSSKREVSGNTYDGANDDSDRNGLRQQSNSEQTDTQQPNEKINENTVFLVNQVEERKEQKNSQREESGTMYDGADDDSDSDGLSQHSNREQTDTQQPNDTINENTVTLMNKVEEQKKQTSSKREVSGNMHVGAEDNSDSVGVRKKSHTEHSDKQQLPIKENKDADRNGFSLWCCTFYSKRRIPVSCPTSDNVVFKVAEKNKQTSSKRDVSGNTYDGANDDSDRNGLRQQSNSEQTDTQQPNEKINENTVFLVNQVEERKEQKNSQREESGTMYDGADDDSDSDGLSQHSNREQTDTQQPNDTINENTVTLMNKVEEQKKQTSSKREVSGNMHDGAEDNSDSVGVRKKSNTEHSDKQQLPIKENKDTDRNGFSLWCCTFYSKHRIPVSCPTSDNVVFKVAEKNKQTSSKREVSGNTYDGANDDSDRNGLRQQSNREETYTQQPNDIINENAVILMNKVEEQKKQTGSKREVSGNMHDGAEDNSDSVGVRQKSNTEHSDKQQLPIKENKDADRNGFPHWCCGFYSKRRIAVSYSTSDSVVFKVEGEKKQTSSEKKVSGNMYAGAADDSDRKGLRHVRNSEQTDTQKPNDKVNENTVFLMNKVEEKKEQTSGKKEESGNMYDGAEDSDSDGLSQHSNREQTDTQQPNDTINENTVILKNKVEEKKESSVGVRQQSKSKLSEKQQLPIMESKESDRNGFSHWCCGFYRKRRIAVSCPTSDNVVFKSEGEKKQTSSKKEVSGEMYDGADDDSDRNGMRHQSNSEQTDAQQPNDTINENTFFLMNKVEEKKEQKSSKREESGNVFDVANEDTDSVGVGQKSNSEQSDKHRFPIVENDDSDRLTTQKEKEKRRKADLLYKKNTTQLRKKEGQPMKAVEINPTVENTISIQVMALETVRGNKVVEERNYTQRQLSQEQNASTLQDGILTKHPCKPKGIERAHQKVKSEVSDSYEKQKHQLHENHILKDEIAKLTLELDTLKNQIQEMEKKYFEDIVIVKEKNDHLQKTIIETRFQHHEQLEVLRAELTMPSTKLGDEQQNRGRLEAEGDSFSSRPATVTQDHEHCQTPKGDLQVAFKKEKEEWFCSQDKKNSDMSDLNYNIEMISQQLSILESNFNHLEVELHHTRDALKERTLVLEGGEGDQSQIQSQKKEIEHVHQKEQGKVNKDTGKQESLQERLSHLQSENKLLQQQLDQAHNKADRKRKRVIKIQDQFADTIKILQAKSDKQGLLLKEIRKELINVWHLLKENIRQYENDKAERDAVVRQLQGELAEIRRKLSSTEALHQRMDSQYKIQELQKELDESRSQLQHEKEESKKYVDLNISLQQSLHEVMKQKNDLEKSMTRFQEPLNVPKRNFNEEHSVPGVVKPSLIEMQMETRRLKGETDELIAASKCMHRPEENTDQQEIEYQELQNKCDEMTTRAQWSRQETIRVRRQMEIKRAEHQEEEWHLERIGECANPYLAYSLEQVRQSLQF